jgi:hypothetical protein
MDFIIPTRIILGKHKKKSFPINVNSFANQHHRVKHNAKMVFYDYIDTLKLKKKYGTLDYRARLHYKYYAERGGLFDEANIGGGLDKFTADALVEYGVLHDDNYKYLKHYTFEFAGINKTYIWNRDDIKGYCEVSILRA